MLRGKRSRLRAPQVDGDTVRLSDVPEDISGLVDDSKLDRLRKHFTEYDADQSGYIDSSELTAVLRGMGFNPTDKRVSEILRAYDTDKNNTLSFGEFVEVWAFYCQEAKMEGELISRAFTFFLPNDCQSMSFSDFKEIMTDIGDALTPEEVDRFFSLVDDESDGILRLDEFMKPKLWHSELGTDTEYMIQVLYNDQSDLTQVASSLGKDGIHPLFEKSSRPQRKSLMQLHNPNIAKGRLPSDLTISSILSALYYGDSWLQRSRGVGLSTSKNGGSPESRCQRNLRSSRNSRCKSLHVEPAAGHSHEASQRDQDKNCSPVRFLRCGTAGPMEPDDLAACLDTCSIEQQAEVQVCSGEAQFQAACGEQDTLSNISDGMRKDPANVERGAHCTDGGDATDRLPPLLPHRRKNTPVFERDCETIDRSPKVEELGNATFETCAGNRGSVPSQGDELRQSAEHLDLQVAGLTSDVADTGAQE